APSPLGTGWGVARRAVLGPRHGGHLLGLGRAALRRSARRAAELARSRRGPARPGAQLPPRSPRPRRGRRRRPAARARLRGPAVLPARLLRVEARPAVRVLRVQPRRTLRPAALRGVALEPRAAAGRRARRGVRRRALPQAGGGL